MRKITVKPAPREGIKKTPLPALKGFYDASATEGLTEETKSDLEFFLPVFRPVLVDLFDIVERRLLKIDEVRAYRRDAMPEGMKTVWPVDLVFFESETGYGHLVEHARPGGDPHWASDLDDGRASLLANVVEAIHQSMPIASREQFKELAASDFHQITIDWIRADHRDVWVRYEVKDIEQEVDHWAMTCFEGYTVTREGFLPGDLILIKEDESSIELSLTMDDFCFEKIKIEVRD